MWRRGGFYPFCVLVHLVVWWVSKDIRLAVGGRILCAGRLFGDSYAPHHPKAHTTTFLHQSTDMSFRRKAKKLI